MGATTLKVVIDILRNAPRQGSDKDEPEGARFITISDTCAKTMVELLECAQHGDVSKAAQLHAAEAVLNHFSQVSATFPPQDRAYVAALDFITLSLTTSVRMKGKE